MPSRRVMGDGVPFRLVRAELEHALGAAAADATLVEAMSSTPGRPDEDPRAVMHLVRGPLRDALGRRIGGERAEGLVGRLEAMLSAGHVDAATSEERRDETRSVTIDGRPVPVLVVADGDRFTGYAQSRLGRGRLSAMRVRTLDRVGEALRRHVPAIVVLDAADLPRLDEAALARTLRGCAPDTVVIVYGSDLPAAQTLTEALRGETLEVVYLEATHGEDAVLDLVRARMAAEAL